MVGLPGGSNINRCDTNAAVSEPAKSAENPSECRTSGSRFEAKKAKAPEWLDPARGIADLRLHTTVRALVTGATALVTLAFLWVTVASSRSQTPAVTTEAEGPPQFVKNVMAELSAPLALVKHTAGHLSTTPPIQILGSERSPRCGGLHHYRTGCCRGRGRSTRTRDRRRRNVLPPLSRQTAFLDERARKGLVGCR